MPRRNTPPSGDAPTPLSIAGLLDLMGGHVRTLIRNGVATERGLALRSGTSQPYLHNVLKGVRHMTPALADRLMREFNMTVADLVAGVQAIPSAQRKGPGSEAPPPPRPWRDTAALR